MTMQKLALVVLSLVFHLTTVAYAGGSSSGIACESMKGDGHVTLCGPPKTVDVYSSSGFKRVSGELIMLGRDSDGKEFGYIKGSGTDLDFVVLKCESFVGNGC